MLIIIIVLEFLRCLRIVPENSALKIRVTY